MCFFVIFIRFRLFVSQHCYLASATYFCIAALAVCVAGISGLGAGRRFGIPNFRLALMVRYVHIAVLLSANLTVCLFHAGCNAAGMLANIVTFGTHSGVPLVRLRSTGKCPTASVSFCMVFGCLNPRYLPRVIVRIDLTISLSANFANCLVYTSCRATLMLAYICADCTNSVVPCVRCFCNAYFLAAVPLTFMCGFVYRPIILSSMIVCIQLSVFSSANVANSLCVALGRSSRTALCLCKPTAAGRTSLSMCSIAI